MNIYILLNIISVPIALTLGMIVYSRDPSNRLNKIFLVFMLITAYTAGCEFFRLAALDEKYAMGWHRASFVWPVFVVVFLVFVLEVTGNKMTTHIRRDGACLVST